MDLTNLDPTTSGDAFQQSAFVTASNNTNHECKNSGFSPRRPESIEEAGLRLNDLFPLILKFLFLHGNSSGNQIAKQINYLLN